MELEPWEILALGVPQMRETLWLMRNGPKENAWAARRQHNNLLVRTYKKRYLLITWKGGGGSKKGKVDCVIGKDTPRQKDLIYLWRYAVIMGDKGNIFIHMYVT